MHYHVIILDEHIRVWRSDSFSDVFDVYEHDSPEATSYQKQLELDPKLFVAGFPENDAGELECNLCKAEQAQRRAEAPKPRGRPRKLHLAK